MNRHVFEGTRIDANSKPTFDQSHFFCEGLCPLGNRNTEAPKHMLGEQSVVQVELQLLRPGLAPALLERQLRWQAHRCISGLPHIRGWPG